jgi:hypothetical protein
MNTPVARLKAYWESSGARGNQPASPEEIQAFETRYGVHVPDDLREYFLVINGLAENEWDEEMIEWYPLHRWKTLPEAEWVPEGLQNPEAYFLFADYCLCGWGYAIYLSANRSNPTPVICVGAEVPPMAQSFSELIEAYLTNPSSLLP